MWNCVLHSKRAYFDTDFYHYYRIRSNSIMENTNKNKSFVNAVSHLYNWHELFLTLKNDMNLFSKIIIICYSYLICIDKEQKKWLTLLKSIRLKNYTNLILEK